MQLTDATRLLKSYIEQVPEYYRLMPEEERLRKPAPNKWSKQEILGHLVDSALNNWKRFTESQYLPQPYQVIRYRQDELVFINWYQAKPLDQLLRLWTSMNEQVLSVMNSLQDHLLTLPIITPSGDPQTLEWLMVDYVEHMRHHLRQVGFEQ